MTPAGNLARDLVHTFDRAYDHACTLTRDLDRALTRAHALDRARDLGRVLTLGRDLDHAHDLTHHLDLTRTLTYALDLTHDLTHDRALAHRDVELALALVHTLGRARDLARDLAMGGESAESLPEASREDEWQPPCRGSRAMVAMALRILPAGSRARYAEELRDELGMLGRWAQLRYAVGFAARSWGLRRSLGESAPARES